MNFCLLFLQLQYWIFWYYSGYYLHIKISVFELLNFYLIMIYLIRSTNVHCTLSRSRSPFLLCFGHGPILVHINLQHSQANPKVCTRVIYLNQTYLYVESLVWLGLGWIRTLDLSNSKWTLYFYILHWL